MKKAILVVSFGSSHIDAVKNSIEKVENVIKEEFKEFEVYRAFTSHKIIKKLKERDKIHVNTPEEALENFKKDNYDQVIVLPLHIIPGEEYDYIKGIVHRYSRDFKDLRMGRPIFYYCGNEEEVPNDYELFIHSIEDILKVEESAVLFGHGTLHPGNAVYGMLQVMLKDKGYKNVFVATVEGYPTMESVIEDMKKEHIKRTKLIPLFLVAGDHVKNDMAGEEEDSLKNLLGKEGIYAEPYMHGLGENKNFRQLYINRVYDLLNNKYEGLGETKKGLK